MKKPDNNQSDAIFSQLCQVNWSWLQRVMSLVPSRSFSCLKTWRPPPGTNGGIGERKLLEAYVRLGVPTGQSTFDCFCSVKPCRGIVGEDSRAAPCLESNWPLVRNTCWHRGVIGSQGGHSPQLPPNKFKDRASDASRMPENLLAAGLCPGPRWGSLQRSTDP